MINANPTTTHARQTKYVEAVLAALIELEHATNHQIWEVVRVEYPLVSLTTVHRVTARLKERGLISCAPKSTSGEERYDITPAAHHHFMCAECGRVCNIPDSSRADKVLAELQSLSPECHFAGRLVLQGICQNCAPKENHE